MSAPAAAEPLVLPEQGEWVTPYTQCIRHHNASPLTFKGTNSWLVASPAGGRCLIVDPGPDAEEVMERCTATAAEDGRAICALVTTHYHADHAGCAAILAARLGVPHLCMQDGTLDGGPLTVPGVDVELFVMPLPGHSSDSAALYVPAARALITGDVIFAQSPTMVCWPDGKMGAYLESLDTLERSVALHGVELLLTGHGPVIRTPAARIRAVREHRLDRMRQVVAAVESGVPAEAAALVDAVYTDIPDRLRPGALRSVHAQLVYAAENGLI